MPASGLCYTPRMSFDSRRRLPSPDPSCAPSGEAGESSTNIILLAAGFAVLVAAGVAVVLALRMRPVAPGERAAAPSAVKAATTKPAPAEPRADTSAPHEEDRLQKWGGTYDLDALSYASEATRLAQLKYSDAQLVDVRLGKVTPKGRVDLASRGAFAAYRFRSPSRSVGADAPGKEPCLLDVVVTGDAVQVRAPEVPAVGCSSKPIAVPQCALADLWSQALKGHTPTDARGNWELAAAPGAKPDAPAPGRWKLTMSTVKGDEDLLFDSSCQPTR